MNYSKYIYLFFILIILISVLIIVSPVIDHLFYIDKNERDIETYQILGMIILHIILLGILIYLIHYYIIKRTIQYFKLNNIYVKVIDLIFALTLTGLQRNLRHKLHYISTKHPIGSDLVE